MVRKWKLVAVVAAVGCALAVVAGREAALWSSSRHTIPSPQPEQAALSVDLHYLDFGEVWETEQFEWTVPVRNDTDEPLRASARGTSCSCVSAGTTNVIPPRGTAPLTFRVDLRAAFCASAEPQAVRATKIGVSVANDSSPAGKPTAIELRGRVKSALAVPARQIDFGRFAATAQPKPRVVPIRSLVPLNDLAASVEGASLAAELKTLAPDKWELHVRPVLTSVVGRHEAKVRLVPTTTGGEKPPAVTIPVAFDVLHDIQPDTSLVPLGAGRVGETLSGTLTVSSLSGRPFPLPTCAGDGVIMQPPSVMAPQSSHTFKIERKVPAAGNHFGTVIVRGRDTDGQPFELRVDAQWYGLAP